MALIICPECGKEFSDRAMSCPNCGCPTRFVKKDNNDSVQGFIEQDVAITQNASTSKKGKKIGILASVIAVVVVIGVIGYFVFQALQKPFSENSEKISKAAKSVVQLYCFDDVNGTLDSDSSLFAMGSGFVCGSDDLIITNYHVIEDALKIIAVTEENEAYEIYYVLNYDIKKDIAVLKTDSPTGLTPLALGSASEMKKGDGVTAIGSPEGLRNSVSMGVFSENRYDEEYGEYLIQFTAPISHGSSGGALFNEAGKVIGMTSASYIEGQNLNFAVPAEEIYNLISSCADDSMQELSSLFIKKSDYKQIEFVDIFISPTKYNCKKVCFECVCKSGSFERLVNSFYIGALYGAQTVNDVIMKSIENGEAFSWTAGDGTIKCSLVDRDAAFSNNIYLDNIITVYGKLIYEGDYNFKLEVDYIRSRD